jgi:hypothetical protein
MSRKIYKPKEILAKLREVEILTAQGRSAVDAIRAIGVTDATYYVAPGIWWPKRCRCVS